MTSYIKYVLPNFPISADAFSPDKFSDDLPLYEEMPKRVQDQDIAAEPSGSDQAICGDVDETLSAMTSEQDGLFTVAKSLNERFSYVYASCGPVRSRLFRDKDCLRRGSGAAIGYRIVLTAAHNVYERSAKGINSPIWFIPGHPFKDREYYAKTVYVARKWVEQQDRFSDIAILVLREAMDIPGYSGVAANISESRQTGGLDRFLPCYPIEPPFKNQTELVIDYGAESRWAFWEGNHYFRDMQVDALGKIDVTPGASGGPWLTTQTHRDLAKKTYRQVTPGFSSVLPAANVHFINGITSFGRSEKPGVVYGPTFDNRIADLIADCINDIALNP